MPATSNTSPYSVTRASAVAGSRVPHSPFAIHTTAVIGTDASAHAAAHNAGSGKVSRRASAPAARIAGMNSP